MFDRSEVLKWVVFGGISLLFLYLFLNAFKSLRKWFSSPSVAEKQEEEEEELMKNTPDSTMKSVEDGGEVPNDFNPLPYVVDLKRVLSEYILPWEGTKRCEVLSKVNKFSDNTLLIIYDTYKNKYNRSLRKALNEVQWSGCQFSFNSPLVSLKDRLEKLGKV